uniref:NADH-ubiquinone oxidoreductase chain 3 n=1 Tax=Calanus sinicus TaxID=114070 RepID=G9BM08_CALSV|nr:NADH dehydrogenase subunit 3 [Calanus sinicus]
MMIFMVFLFSALLLVSGVTGLGVTLGKKLLFDREKLSPFECGFSPKFNARLPFTLRFFLIAIIFLVFDVELILLFPFLSSVNVANIYMSAGLVLVFIAILFGGLVHEWNQGSLDWAV